MGAGTRIMSKLFSLHSENGVFLHLETQRMCSQIIPLPSEMELEVCDYLSGDRPGIQISLVKFEF